MTGLGWNGGCVFGSLGNLGWAGWIINLVLTLGVLIGLILLVVWAVRRITKVQGGSLFSSTQNSGLTNAQEIIRARYARGEITREEYLQIIEDIR